MSQIRFPDALADRGVDGKKIVLFVLDGLGGDLDDVLNAERLAIRGRQRHQCGGNERRGR